MKHRFSFVKKNSYKPIILSNELNVKMCFVENILKDRKKVDKIVSVLIHLPGDIITKIRFCAAVIEFENINDMNERMKKGILIINLFFETKLI